jgi:hypothetical protein
MITTILAWLKAKKAVLIGIIVISLIALGFYFGVKLFRSEMKRMENNYLAAIEQLRGDNKEQQRVYELKLSEVKNQFPELKQQLKDMDIKLKNVVSIENVNTETKTEINTHIRDTIMYDTVPARVATYKDAWTDFKLIEINNDLKATIVTKDSIVCVLNRVRRDFGQWWRREPKQVRNTIKNFNPNSTITYNRLITIDK